MIFVEKIKKKSIWPVTFKKGQIIFSVIFMSYWGHYLSNDASLDPFFETLQFWPFWSFSGEDDLFSQKAKIHYFVPASRIYVPNFRALAPIAAEKIRDLEKNHSHHPPRPQERKFFEKILNGYNIFGSCITYWELFENFQNRQRPCYQSARSDSI